mmetsp:Transcript_108085/g.344578  ORF Transcript_108085/g.344578 Transcript_108085/m.344578 type:complete len:203 (-) Transcript_108085:843-1451(-)
MFHSCVYAVMLAGGRIRMSMISSVLKPVAHFAVTSMLDWRRFLVWWTRGASPLQRRCTSEGGLAYIALPLVIRCSQRALQSPELSGISAWSRAFAFGRSFDNAVFTSSRPAISGSNVGPWVKRTNSQKHPTTAAPPAHSQTPPGKCIFAPLLFGCGGSTSAFPKYCSVYTLPPMTMMAIMPMGRCGKCAQTSMTALLRAVTM